MTGERFDADAAVRRMRGQESKIQRPKDRTAAPVQITAEQLLSEALARQEAEPKPPRQRIDDPEELKDAQMRKRKQFEDAIRRQRFNINNWMKYAGWEESQKEVDRARSIYERALDVDYRSPPLWIKYAELEMKNKFINHARNIWDRAVTLLPRVDLFWYKYTYMEEQLGNYVGARQIFERWMQWHPEEQAWNSYIKFELRHKEIECARAVYERFVACHPKPKVWIKFAKFEEKAGETQRAREIYEQALKFLGEDVDEIVYIHFAQFEERAKEFERARAIYKYALDHVPKHLAQELYKTFIGFEKTHGDRDAIEEVIVGKRRFQYEEELKVSPKNYDVWFDYARLEEAYGDAEKVREVYERAIANVPPAQDKRFWRRYIYLWINYALYEELDARNAERAREVYATMIRQIPHKAFSFSKVWIMYANFEIRQKQLGNVRKVLGHALGVAPKHKIFKTYIDLEHKLGNIDRVRTLYAKYIEYAPQNVAAWVKFADLEKSLAEFDRARYLFELAIEQPVLDMPELLWKTYIDFEAELDEFDKVRDLYRRLLERTKHVKVWISQAQFEASIGQEEAARRIYQEAYTLLKTAEIKEERVMLVENWLEWEKSLVDAAQAATPDKPADQTHLDHVEKLLPKRIKRKRTVKAEDGTDAGWEEYYDYTFPDEQAAQPQLAILQFAHMWKKQKMLAEEGAKEADEKSGGEEEDPQELFERAEAEEKTKKQKTTSENPDADDSE